MAPGRRDELRDAHYADEWLAPPVRNPASGAYLSRFNRYTGQPGSVTAAMIPALKPQSAVGRARNPLDIAVTPGLNKAEPVVAPSGSCRPDPPFWLYVPPPVQSRVTAARAGAAAPAIDATVLFTVDYEMNRHGLRIFFERADRVLITVPGREPAWCGGRAWAVGISRRHVDGLFGVAGLAGVQPRITVMAAFSTGYRGLNGTLFNHDKLGLDLSGLRRIVFFDCLYVGDARGQIRTAEALERLRRARPDVEVVVYESTRGGVRRIGGRMPVDLEKLFSKKVVHIDLKGRADYDQNFSALVAVRVVDGGIRDGYFDKGLLPQSMRELVDALPARGTIASEPERVKQGGTSFTAWVSDNEAALKVARRQLAPVLRNFINRHVLLGWRPRGPGELAHDGLVPEFGWEFLH